MPAADQRQAIGPLRRRAQELEAQMHRLSGLIEKADAFLARPDAFTLHSDKAQQIARDRAALAARLAETEDAWLEASDEIEKLTGG